MNGILSLSKHGLEKDVFDGIYDEPGIRLSVDDLSFSYNPKKGLKPTLEGVTLDIRGAQLLSILGPNGVGKSTFIHCMNRILEPTEGAVTINDYPVKDIPLKDMAKLTGYVPYSANDSFPLSVTDTILMGRHPHSKLGSLDEDLEVVESVLKLIGIEDLADRMFNELSAGQHQKVMLARGLAQEPRILFLDEPTSNLDIKYQLEITRLLKRLSRERNMLVIMISHDINIAAKYSDNILMLLDGGIYAAGKPSDVITEKNLKVVYGVDAKIIDDCGRPHMILVDNEAQDTDDGEFSISVPKVYPNVRFPSKAMAFNMSESNNASEGAICFEEAIIRCEDLTKDFGSFRAVDGINLKINRGEIYGFLGPNGAGKTTTVRMLTTMERPTSGRVWIDGHDTSTDYIAARRNLGVIQQQNSLDKDISVRDNIMHHALIQGLSFRQARERMAELCPIMELDSRMDDLVETLSGGWKKRVSIVCSMIHDPDVLFLDEPTTGLDTQSRNLLWRMIRSLNHRGTTIFLTTHYIYEAESLCDRVGLITHGHLIAEGTPDELIGSVGRFVTVTSPDEEQEPVMRFFATRKEAMEEADRHAGDHDTIVRKTTLEDAFLEITGRMARCATSSARRSASHTATCVF